MRPSYFKLTARKVQTERTSGRHPDGGGLHLNVAKSGTRSWVFIYSVAAPSDGAGRQDGRQAARDGAGAGR